MGQFSPEGEKISDFTAGLRNASGRLTVSQGVPGGGVSRRYNASPANLIDWFRFFFARMRPRQRLER